MSMKHKLLLFLTALLLALMPVGKALAKEVTIDGIRYSYEIGKADCKVVPNGGELIKGWWFGDNYPYLLGTVTLPSVVKDRRVNIIDNYAFAYVKTSNFSIVCPPTLRDIGGNAFTGSALISISLNEGLKTVGERCFLECEKLSSITTPKSLTMIPASCFEWCINLVSVNLPSITTIHPRAFSSCKALLSVNGGNDPCPVEIIMERAFAWCFELQTINFAEDKLQSIGEYAFVGCEKLENLTLPASLIQIGDYAFQKSGLKVLRNNNPVPQSIKANVFEGVNLSKCILYVPKGCKAAYQAAEVWKKFGTILEPGEQVSQVQGIEKPLFEGEKLAVIDGIPYSLNGTKRTAKVVSDKTNPSPSGKVVLPATVNYEGNDFTLVEIGTMHSARIRK